MTNILFLVRFIIAKWGVVNNSNKKNALDKNMFIPFFKESFPVWISMYNESLYQVFLQ